MKTSYLFLSLLTSLPLVGGCANASRRSNANVAAHYGADVVVLGKLERGAWLSFADLEELGRRGVPDNVARAHLQRRDDAYRLNTAQLLQLREAGVTDRVIDLLLASPDRVAWRAQRSAPIWGYHDAYGHHYSGFGHGGWQAGVHHYGGHH